MPVLHFVIVLLLVVVLEAVVFMSISKTSTRTTTRTMILKSVNCYIPSKASLKISLASSS